MHSDCWYKKVCTNECESVCIRYTEMKYLTDNSNIPKVRQYPATLIPDDCDYDSFCKLKEIKDSILEFVKDGKNLYIASNNTGNGKTTWSIKLMMKYFDEVWAGNGLKVRGLFVHVPTLLLKLKNFQDPVSEEYKRNLMECDLVIWDEMGSVEISNYDYTNLLMFMENRLLNYKSNIFTSNSVTRQDLEGVVGSKLMSRIWNDSEIIILKGSDKRGFSSDNK